MNSRPNVRSAPYWLWARHRSRTFSAVDVPPRAHFDCVIELEELSSLAAMSVVADERALPAVALPDDAFHLRRNLASARRLRRVLTRPAGGRELALLELGDQRIQGPVQDLGQVATRNRVAQQLPRVAQLVVGAPADREPQREAL